MLKQFIVLIIIMIAIFGCAQKSSEWTEEHILQLTAAVPVVGNPLDLAIAGTNVYLTEDQGGLSIINLNDYSRKWITSFVSSDGDTIQLVKIRRVSVDLSINRLFINETDGSDEIRVIDISNPDSMLIVDRITGATQDIGDMKFQAITDTGSQFIYEGFFCAGRNVNYGKYGAHISGLPPYFAITLPVNTPATSKGAFLSNQYIYAAAEQRGLLIYSRTGGTLVGELDLPGEAQKVKVVGNYAYLPCRQDGLQIVNISNPASPVKVSSYDTSGYATNVDIWNNYAVVSSGGGGVYLFDITNPANPVLKDNITDCGYTNNVRFYDGKVLVASRDYGLLVYNIVP